jgi:hypothetical protein
MGIEQGFISDEFGSQILVVDSDPKQLVERLMKHTPPLSSLKQKTGITLTDKQT